LLNRADRNGRRITSLSLANNPTRVNDSLEFCDKAGKDGTKTAGIFKFVY
jgi:hypothetical protein